MNCRNFYRNLEDYLDGGLDFAGRIGMERHADKCFTCGKELADARGLRLLTVSLARVKAPMDFEARVSREIVRRKTPGVFTQVHSLPTFGFGWRRFVLAATVCSIMTFGFFFARQIRQNALVSAVAEQANSAEEDAEFVESPDNLRMDALDLLLVNPGSYPNQEQLPRKIHVRYGPPSEEYFIRNVSH